MDATTDLADNIKACRTCGIHFVSPSKHQLKHLFQSCQDHSEIMLIRLELAQWKIEVSENDGFPQYVCNSCIHKFEQVFQLRAACINAQNEFRKFYAVPNGNVPNIKIKTEIADSNDEPAICDFIYVDELSDGEYDGTTPFNIPHIPIKEEVIEAAAIPMEDSEQPLNVVESASSVVMPSPSSYSHESDFVTQNATATAALANAILPVSDEVECSLCHDIFPNQEYHKHHMETVHDIKDLECHICGKEFKNSTSARLRFHMKWHTLNKQIKCNFCSFTCHSKGSLAEHKRMNHRKTKCKICGKAVLAKKMKSHLQNHELQQYPCEYCARAFATENERETHIWQIHATEDNSAANSIINSQTCYTHQANDNVTLDETMCHEPQENFLYKYICAHCDHRFMIQMDLETHVREEHRSQLITQTEAVQNINEHAAFDKYKNTNEMHVDPAIHSSILTQEVTHTPTSASFIMHNENIGKDGTKLAGCSSADDGDTTESEDETSDLSTYVGGDLNMFACAKCSETFATIEGLRDHHEQHLLAEPNKSPTKSNFQCNVCGKFFDLKFRLNRHIKKHKGQAPL